MLNKINVKNKISAFRRLTNNQENMCKNETEPKGFVQVQFSVPEKSSAHRRELKLQQDRGRLQPSPAVVCGSVGE